MAALSLFIDTSRAFAASPYGAFSALDSIGLPSNGDVSQVVINQSNEMYVTIYGDGVYMSSDGGHSFLKVAPPNFGMQNDIPNTEMMTMIVNALGEPIIGCREVGAQQGQYLFRLDWSQRKWVAATIPAGYDISNDGYDPTGSQAIIIGGVSIPKQRRFPRHMTLDNNGAIWLGWAYIPGYLKSTDNGDTYTFTRVPNATTGLYTGTGPGNLYSFNFNPDTGEYFYGTELIGFWHSTDGGNSWQPFDPSGMSVIGAHQNDYSISFNKDQEPIFSNWGRTATNSGVGDVFTILDRDGIERRASNGLSPWQFNYQNVFYQFNGGDAIMRNVRVASAGYNFISAYSSNYYGTYKPDSGKQTVYLSPDGYNWVEADPNQPFASPYCNSIWSDGTDVFVGGTGKVWKFQINVQNHIPTVRVTAPVQPQTLNALITVSGEATDLDGDPLTFRWHARGNGTATFADPNALSTTVTFSRPGDYVLTLTADDGHRTSSGGAIVHILNTPPQIASPASVTQISPTQAILSVLGDDLPAEGGEPALSYTWVMQSGPSNAQVTFAQNGNNGAKQTTATFSKAGSYVLTALIQDTGGLVTTSSVGFTVDPALTVITIEPLSVTIANNDSKAFSATALDQFGVLTNPQPTFAWSVDGGGSISAQGIFTAGPMASGSFTVTASSGSVSGTAAVTVIINQWPVVDTQPSSTPAVVTLPQASTLTLSATDPDQQPAPALTYTWSKVSGPGTVQFSPNGTTSATVSASFSMWGSYLLKVDIFDGVSTVSSTLSVQVNPDPTQPIPILFQEGVNGYSGEVDRSITTQSQAAYNGNNGNTFSGTTLYCQNTTGQTKGFIAESLIKFGNITLPAGAKVLSASLTLNFTTYSPGYTVTGYYLNTYWNPFAPQYKLGWINRDTSLTWNTPGALGPGTDLIAGTSFTMDGFRSGINQVKTVALDPSVVRSWIENPAANQGILLTSSVGAAGNITSGSNAATASRPLLTIIYELAVAKPAAANPSVVNGTSTNLSVLGQNFPAEGGESSLRYTWSVKSSPAGANVLFSDNGTNSAKNTVATFDKAGNYTFTATLTDTANIAVTSSVNVVVNAVASNITISPADATVPADRPTPFLATAQDQFGSALDVQPTFTWTISGGGAVDAAGIFTPSGSATGMYTLTAASGSLAGSTTVQVVDNAAPIIGSVTATPSSFALPNGTTLSIDATDPDAYPNNGALIYSWSMVSGPAAVTFSSNDSAAASQSQASFTVAGTYVLRVHASDGLSSTTSDVTVTVAPDPSVPVSVTFQQGVNGYTGEADLSISTQSRLAYNGFNGNTFRGATLYCQDTTGSSGGFKAESLIRFNLQSIPPEAIVVDASLKLSYRSYTTGLAVTGRYLLASWDPLAPQYKIGWLNRDANNLWATPGAAGEGTDLVANQSFGFVNTTTGSALVKTVPLDTSIVKGWIQTPSSNQGILLVCPLGLNMNISSGSDTTVSKRPLLSVTYHL